MCSSLRVALVIDSYVEYGRGLLRGIGSYMRANAKWTTYHQPWISRQLRRWRPDGLIVELESRELVRQVQSLGTPVVGISSCQLKRIPTFFTDHEAVARLAADHLLERGFKHFAYAGFAGARFSEQRRQAFVDYLARSGHPVAVFEGPKMTRAFGTFASIAYCPLSSREITDWLKSLPRPVGLMGCGDTYARQIINACTEYGIAVPDEVAVIGVGNDDMLCNLCSPCLSTVAVNAEKIGYEAAAMLDRWMHGKRPAGRQTLVGPKGVVTRQSTDTLLGADADVVDAIRYVRQHACEGIHVKDVFRHTMLSRSTLQRLFIETLGRSPKAELLRVQLERVKELLADTDLPHVTIAHRAGFNHVECMCRLFKKRTGQTPRQYRRETRR